MSSLIFYSDKDQVLTATDTLATTPNGEPAFFTTKAFVLPHLQMIMVGTGLSGFLGKWFVEVNDRMVVQGIDNLNYHAPKILASLWTKFREENLIPDNLTTTVYQLGFSEEKGSIHIYVYRSAKNFTSEALPYGVVTKPEVRPPENPVFPICVKMMMEEQRSNQDSLPWNNRVHIGGKIQIHHLTRDGISIYTLDQFEDFESLQQEIYDNYDSKKTGGQAFHETQV